MFSAHDSCGAGGAPNIQWHQDLRWSNRRVDAPALWRGVFFFCILFFSVLSVRRVTIRTQVAPIIDLSMERVVQRCIVPLLFLTLGEEEHFCQEGRATQTRGTMPTSAPMNRCSSFVISSIACESVL